ncbi:hypothetical protein SUGI_0683160 [Cryptomeria japonica]|nr:hypothetical protein SUGI_0683160 [Cryptomeria japonica]
MVVKNVMNRVLKEMDTVPLEVAKHPVGMDEAVRDFDTIALQSGGENVQIVGIWGMGGSGKTTLAKEIYNKRCLSVNFSSFLSDVGDAAERGLLLEKQKTLLKDFNVKDVSFDNVHRGKQILNTRVKSVSVLIIVDDVHHTDQLDTLLPTRENLGHGSLIIVTTRELDVLKSWDISAIYPMRALSPTHAKELFCWHAFLQSSPLSGFKNLVDEFLNSCHGLPLSLKVLGGQLYGRSDKDYWQRTLGKYSGILPNEIKERLKISYDALDEEEKEMFLDTACFFIGRRSSTAIAVWDASKWDGLLGWERLLNKCLAEIDEGNRIKMHDHLRDLGRDIANRQTPYRAWFRDQIIKILPQQERIQIRGIADAIGDKWYSPQGEIIVNTNQGVRGLTPCSVGLKILVCTGHYINKKNGQLPSDLVWLRCYQFQHSHLPSWLSLKSLRILELHGARNLEDLWDTDANAPLQLREVRIVDYGNFRGFPKSIGDLKHLKEIWIKPKSSEMANLPNEFSLLRSLEHLHLSRCRKLSSLPRDFGNLVLLWNLDLSYCSQLTMLPQSFKQLVLLEYLNLEGCEELTFKSENLDILEDMIKLEYLNLNGCRKLELLPLPRGASLTELYLKDTKLRELPANIGHLSKLPVLEISSELLETLPNTLDCPKVKKIESIEGLESLEKIKIIDCGELEALPRLADLTSLKTLNLRNCPKLEMEGSECLGSLKKLNIVACPGLQALLKCVEELY